MRNILIVKLSAIGDVVHALPTAHALKKVFPNCRITWVVEKQAQELVQANSYVDEVIVFDKPKCKTVGGILEYAPGFFAALRKRNFDLSLDLQGLFKSAVISRLSGASRRLVYCNAREMSDWAGRRVCGPNQQGHIIDQYLDVVRALGDDIGDTNFGLTLSDEVSKQARSVAAFAGLDVEQNYAVLVPGANWPNKRWPTSHFASLADKLFDAQIIPVLTGGLGDDFFAEEISKAALIPPVDLTGKTSLPELAYIISRSRLVIGGDTGPVHLAAALDKPVIMLMGPTEPNRNGPYGSGNVVLTAGHECDGCWKRECQHNRDCLDKIAPDIVYQAAVKLLTMAGIAI